MSGADSGAERLDREVIELINELRVALPGIQPLFGFLLLLPFHARLLVLVSTALLGLAAYVGLAMQLGWPAAFPI